MPESTIDIEMPDDVWAIIKGMAVEKGVSTNELIVQIATEHAREVLARHAEDL